MSRDRFYCQLNSNQIQNENELKGAFTSGLTGSLSCWGIDEVLLSFLLPTRRFQAFLLMIQLFFGVQ